MTYEWSTTYRRHAYVSDSDSDIDANAAHNHERLVREMDLSSRHEAVEYHPNPWSIARINAASRPNPVQAKNPTPSPKPILKPIVEAFKKQADRAGHPDVSKPRDASSDKLPVAKHNTSSTKMSRQDCNAHPQPTGSTNRQNSAHTSTIPDPPLKPTGTHRVVQSSLTAAVGRAVRGRPALPVRDSSPGARLHGPGSAHAVRQPLPPPPRTSNQLTKTNDDHPLPRDEDRGTASMWLMNALDQGIRDVPQARALPEPRQDDNSPANTPTPEAKRKRAASPRPTPPRKKPLLDASRLPTAYDFGQDDDPDAGWSTLKRKTGASAKRAAKPKLTGVKWSGGFRLPLLGVAPPRPPRTPTRRVITYLPPPMASKKRTDASARHQVRLDGAVNPPTVTEAEEEDEVVRMMDSDVTLVNEDEDDVARIDVDDVCERYPATRACLKAMNRARNAIGCIVEVSKFGK